MLRVVREHDRRDVDAPRCVWQIEASPKSNGLPVGQRLGNRPHAEAERLVVHADLKTIAQQSDDRISTLRKRARLQQLFLWLDTEVMSDVEDVCDEGQVNCTWLQAHVDEGKRDRVGVGWCGESP